MNGLQTDAGYKTFLYAFSLEFVFLAFCVVLIGAGYSELKRQKSPLQNTFLMVLGVLLSTLSFFVTYLFIKG